MLDRVPLYPGRVKLIPVAGQENTYDMTRADQATQQGTPLNKATFLKDDTAALFGLGAEAVPNDAFGLLAYFKNNFSNEYFWVKETHEYSASFDSSEIRLLNTSIGSEITYYENYEATKDGILLTNPISITLSDSNYTQLSGKYVYKNTNGDPGVVDNINRSGNRIGYTGRLMDLQDTLSNVEYVNSSDKNAYPPEIDDGFVYNGPKILGSFAAVETGSYVGTGGAGSSQKTSVTFSISPKVLFVSATTNGGSNALGTAIFVGGAYAGMYILSQSQDLVLSIDGNTWSWYDPGSNAAYQCNQVNTAYNYVAIG